MANWAQKLKLHHLQMLVALGEQGNLTHVARMMNIFRNGCHNSKMRLESHFLSGTAKDYVRLKAANCYCNMPNG